MADTGVDSVDKGHYPAVVACMMAVQVESATGMMGSVMVGSAGRTMKALRYTKASDAGQLADMAVGN